MKKTKLLFIFIATFLFISTLIVTVYFTVDIGINSKIFIKKDFYKAFEYRSTGDCETFIEYIGRDKEDWLNTCMQEKTFYEQTPGKRSLDKYGISPIIKVKILNLTHNYDSEIAYIQALVIRHFEYEDIPYIDNYEIRKIDSKWKIYNWED